jgi:hypothetical protein
MTHFERPNGFTFASQASTGAFYDKFLTKLEAVLTDQQDQLTAITALQSQMSDRITEITQLQADMLTRITEIEAAQAAADAAQADATASYREAARINSYTNPGIVLSASDAGTDATITIANHTRIYPVQGSIDVPDVPITGGSLTGLTYGTEYYVYYDDTTLASTTPTFIATTTAAEAQVGHAAGRHCLSFITTPASGGGATSGGGTGTPGGTGGGGGSGGYLP